MVLLIMCSAEFTVEGKVQHPEHIKRSEHGSYHTDDVHGCTVRKYMPQDLVFRKETCKRRDTRDSQRADQHGGESYFKLAFQSAHVTHVLFAANCVDNRA